MNITTRYSKSKVEFTAISGNVYKAHKLAPLCIMMECAKLVKVGGTALGAAGDAYLNRDKFEEGVGFTLTSLTNMINENFEDEHMFDLQTKFFKELYFVNEDGKDVKITDEHFESTEYMKDFLEVWWWLFKENIVNFIQASDMYQSKIAHWLNKISPTMKNEIDILLKNLKLDSNEK